METQPNDTQTAPVEGNASQPVPESVKPPESVEQNTPTNNTTPQETVIDYQKRYNDLRSEFDKRNARESEVAKKLTSFEAEQKRVAEMMAKLTAEPYNPDIFMENLRNKGPKFLEDHFNQWKTGLEKKYDTEVQNVRSENLNLSTRLEVLVRRGDDINYPDFIKLEEKMKEIAADENCPIDLSKPIPEVLDALYKLAREQHSVEAIKEAEKLGAKSKEEELAKEARTAVATGGKHTGTIPTDPSKITDINELRKFFVDRIGEAEYNR